LTNIAFHLLKNSEKLAKLRALLEAAMKDPFEPENSVNVEQLPFFVNLVTFPLCSRNNRKILGIEVTDGCSWKLRALLILDPVCL
jgi:hypothetical protein